MPDESEQTELVTTIEVHTRLAPEGDPFYHLDNLRGLENASIGTWSEMDAEERKALIVLLNEAMVHMMEDPDAWLPGSLIADSNQRIQVVLTFQLGNMRAATAISRRRYVQHKVEQRDELLELRRDLADGR